MPRGRMSSGFSRRFVSGFGAHGLVLLVVSAPTLAGIVVSHPPLPTGGPASDTAFDDGFVPWQRAADDFVLDSPATILRVNWWGFYNQDNPPATETMRIRFMGARPGDGLPDENNVVFEDSFLNPSRSATGQVIATGVLPAEYLYEVDLASPAELDGNTPYWLEIVQIGDPQTHFRWEFSFTDQNDFAFINPIVEDWMPAHLGGDLAFQLSTIPEPSACLLSLLGTVLLINQSRRWTFAR